MSKFLKFIVHFVIICTMLCVLGIALPPFFGVQTVIMDDADKATNLPMGSVTYAIPEKTEDVLVGTPILVQEDSKVYRYNIASVNLENGTGTVINPKDSSGQSITVAVKDYVPKVVLTVNFLGYLLVATESVEGLIVLGLVILFLIILYIIAELWKKSPQEEQEYSEEETGHIKTPKELKREEKERARLYKEEERQIRKEQKGSRKRKKAEKRMIRTGGFVDEIEEEDEEIRVAPSRPVVMQNAASEAHEVLKKEIAAATAEPEKEKEEQRTVKKPASSARKARPSYNQTRVRAFEEGPEELEEEEVPEPVEIKKMVVPRLTPAELAEEAKQEGDAPYVSRDDVTQVTLFDYSDIIGENEEE